MIVNSPFDELTRSMAQSVTRRAALKRFGVGLAGMALTCFGIATAAHAGKLKPRNCDADTDCLSGEICCESLCVAEIPDWCNQTNNDCCCRCVYNKKQKQWSAETGYSPCHPAYNSCEPICEWTAVMGACG